MFLNIYCFSYFYQMWSQPMRHGFIHKESKTCEWIIYKHRKEYNIICVETGAAKKSAKSEEQTKLLKRIYQEDTIVCLTMKGLTKFQQSHLE